MRHLPIVHHAGYGAQLDPTHRFPMGKFARVAETLVRDGLVPNRFHVPQPATRDQLIKAHSPLYVDQVLTGSLSDKDVRRLGLPLTDSVIARACLATGGTLLAARLALEHGLACNTAGGSHHAGPDYGAGFCVFNDVAVAARNLLSEQPDRKILIVDLDVHHGDGTALMFQAEPSVTTFSIHCAENWPLIKPASDLDIGLPAGTGDGDYLAILENTLPDLLARTQPDLVFYIAGVDPHKDDRLGKLSLTDKGLMARERFVIEHVRGSVIPLVSVLGGGYSNDLDALAARHALVFHACADWLSGQAAP